MKSATKAIVVTIDPGVELAMQPGPGEVTAMAFCVKSGASDDPPLKRGLANLMADTLPVGTTKHDNRWLTERFDFLGVHRNCSASIEFTHFGATFLPDHLDAVTQLTAEIFLQPSFPSREVDTARERALQELQAIEDEPRQKIFRILNEAYLGPILGRETLGSPETLSHITRKDILSQHSRAFTPANTVVAVGGKFDPKSVRTAVSKYFSKWKQPPVTPQAVPAIPLPAPVIIHHPKESDQEQIALAFPSVARTDPDYFVARVVAAILSGGMSARLFTEIREKRGLVYAVSAWHTYMRGFGYFAAYAGTTPERAQETLDVLCAELNRAGKNISTDELRQAKVGLKSKLIIRSEQPSAQASRVMGDLLYLGHLQTLEEIAAAIDAVTVSRIAAFMEKYPPAPMTVATLGPKKLQIPGS